MNPIQSVPNPAFWRDKRVCVTGGTGFLGWHLVGQLLPLAAHVRILGLRPRSETLRRQLEGLDCIFADVRDPSATGAALRDCDVVIHTAGIVSMWGPSLVQMHEIHVEGTRQVLQALDSGARLVHTSSVMAVGASRTARVLTEAAPFDLARLKVDYVHAKKAAEDLVLAAAQTSDAVVVNPGYMIGPEDHDGSVMGRFCLRCWKGKVPLIPPGGMSFVDVRDVARGHLLAAERGQRGRRYILGGANLTMVEFVRRLADVHGQSSRWWFRMPIWLQVLIACGAELRSRTTQRQPYPSMQHVRMNRYHWYYSSDRARSELGFETRPLQETLTDMHRWFCEAGKLTAREEVPASSSRPLAA